MPDLPSRAFPEKSLLGSPPLTSPKRIRELLDKYGLRADKGFGQNFLLDAQVLRDIVTAAEISSDDTVFEIGPGLGVLTCELLERAKKVISVEADVRLEPLLKETLANCGTAEFKLVLADALTYDMKTLPPNTIMVANLPYNVATPLLANMLASGRFQRLVGLVQKEVADRLKAEPNTSAYGALSLWTQYYADVSTVRHVKPTAFFPPPKVTSSVIKLITKPDVKPDPRLFKLIEVGFRHRRKTLKKNFLMAGYEKTLIENMLLELELPLQVRAEALALETFIEIKKNLT